MAFTSNYILIYYLFDKLSCEQLGYLARHFCKILDYAISDTILFKIHLHCWYKTFWYTYIYIFLKLIISKMIINNKNLTGTLFYKEIQIKILEERVVWSLPFSPGFFYITMFKCYLCVYIHVIQCRTIYDTNYDTNV